MTANYSLQDFTPKTLTFHESFIDSIIEGRKYRTVRYQPSQPLRPGHTVYCRDSSGWHFATVELTEVDGIRVGDFVNAQMEGHRTYRTVDEFFEEFAQYYPEESITQRSRVTVVSWNPDEVVSHLEEFAAASDMGGS